MSEITAESIVENYVKHLQMLTIEELTSDNLTEMARDAVQAALLVGFARGKDAFPSDEFYWDLLGKDAEPEVSGPLCAKCGGHLIDCEGVSSDYECERCLKCDWHDTRKKSAQPPTPAQPEGEKPPRDYRDDLLSCAKADAERLRNDAAAAEAETESVRIRMNYLENVVNENLRQERDEARIELASLRSTLQNVRYQINTLYRNCGG